MPSQAKYTCVPSLALVLTCAGLCGPPRLAYNGFGGAAALAIAKAALAGSVTELE